MKKIAVLLSFVLLIALFTGCEKTEVVSEGLTSSEKTNNETAAEDEEKSEEKSEEARVVELEVMMSIARYTKEMETYFEQFEKKMLEEKNVQVTINLEMPSSDQYEQILQTRLAAGEAPDLFNIHAIQHLPTYADAGYLMDLSDQPFVDTLFDDIKKTVSYNDQVYLVPMESLAWGYLYNKDIFESLGLKAPDTIDEMNTVVTTLKDNGYTPFELAFQDSWVPQLMTALAIGGYVSEEVPDWVERMYKDDGSYEEIAEIFNIIDIIMENGTNRPFETGFDQGCVDFANGEAAMWVNGTWAAESILASNPDITIGVGALPVNNNKAATMVNLTTSTSLGVYSMTDEPEIALELANYILDQEDSSALYQSMLFSPVSTVHDYEQFSWNEDAYAYVAEGRAYTDLVLPNAVTGEQASLLQEYYIGSVTKEDIISTLDAKYQEANRIAAE